jgi:tetratricopeptide (TPR) repeat protein
MLWPSIHAAVDVYQRRRASAADHYELIWRLIHICECTVITLASAAISRIAKMDKKQEFLKLRERCYGITWNSTENSLEKSQGALDGSIDKWIEITQSVASLDVTGSGFLTALHTFLVGSGSSADSYCVDLAPLTRAWGRACDVPPSVVADRVSVKDTFYAINSFRNRFAHVPFPYDQLQEIYRELEVCTFKIFEILPSAANDESPLSGAFAVKDSVLQGSGHRNTPDNWQAVNNETFVWGKKTEPETWDARPFILLDKMMRPYLVSRLKNEAGSWEYTRYLAEANAVYSISNPDLLKLLPRPDETDYRKDEPAPKVDDTAGSEVEPNETPLSKREEAFAAIRRRDFEPAIKYWKDEVDQKPFYHSGWQRLGFAQREYGVDLMDSERDRAEGLLTQSIASFDHATEHSDPQYEAEAYYNRSKSHWRLWRLTEDKDEFSRALRDAETAATRFYDHRFVSWVEFLNENVPSEN